MAEQQNNKQLTLAPRRRRAAGWLQSRASASNRCRLPLANSNWLCLSICSLTAANASRPQAKKACQLSRVVCLHLYWVPREAPPPRLVQSEPGPHVPGLTCALAGDQVRNLSSGARSSPLASILSLILMKNKAFWLDKRHQSSIIIPTSSLAQVTRVAASEWAIHNMSTGRNHFESARFGSGWDKWRAPEQPLVLI